jgi:hypothetical protein
MTWPLNSLQFSNVSPAALCPVDDLLVLASWGVTPTTPYGGSVTLPLARFG